MAWCQVDNNEEGFKSKIICKGCKIMESGKQGDSHPDVNQLLEGNIRSKITQLLINY